MDINCAAQHQIQAKLYGSLVFYGFHNTKREVLSEMKKLASLLLALTLLAGCLTLPAAAAGPYQEVIYGGPYNEEGNVQEDQGYTLTVDKGRKNDDYMTYLCYVPDGATITLRVTKAPAEPIYFGVGAKSIRPGGDGEYDTSDPAYHYVEYMSNSANGSVLVEDSKDPSVAAAHPWPDSPEYMITGPTTRSITIDAKKFADCPYIHIYIGNQYEKSIETIIQTAVLVLDKGSTPAKTAFKDVPATAYFAESVKWATEQKITGGTTATTFAPNATCTTAQILTFLWRANGSPAPTGKTPFTDIAAGAYYQDAAAWAAEKGLISGTTFGGDTPCTRSATVSYLWTLAGKPTAAAATFTDVAAAAEYAPAVAWAVEQKITGGTTATTFAPDTTCTRAQIVTFLFRDLAK